MIKLPSVRVTARFWHWFSNKSKVLAGEVDNDIANEITAEVKGLAPTLGWEIGPGAASRLYFCLTLNSDRKNIEIAEAVISKAPAILDWEFYAGRPRKQWGFTFEMKNRRGQRVAIDASEWEYSLTGYSDRSFFDVQLLATNLPRMDAVAKQEAAWIVVQGALGERLAVDRIGEITLVESESDIDLDQATPVMYLFDHITSLCGSV